MTWADSLKPIKDWWNELVIIVVGARRFLGGLTLAILVLIIWLFWSSGKSSLYDVGYLAMIVLILTLIAIIALTGHCDSGEVRASIALSIVILFFALVSIGNGINAPEGSILDKVLSNFWVVLSSVIAFYFAGRAIENAASMKAEAAKQQQSGATADKR